MFRLVTFAAIFGAAALWVTAPINAQRNPEPYEKPKKKSTAKADTSKAKETKSDTTKAAKADTTKKAKKKDDKKKEKASKDDKPASAERKEKTEEPAKAVKKTTEKVQSQRPVSKAAKPVATKPKTVAGPVKRAVFTTVIVGREPQDDVDTLTTQSDSIFFFTEIVDMAGQAVTHRWVHSDTIAAEVTFNIGGPRWRVYSRKRFLPAWVGRWTVIVVDEAGKKLHEDSFSYVASTR